MKNNSKYILITIAILLFAIPISSYIIQFKDLPISDDPEKWGPFGDFFGGILNTYISLLTLIVTAYIAYEISKLDEKRNSKTLDFERKRFLNELRETEYKRIASEIQKVALAVTPDGDKEEIFGAIVQLEHFSITNRHLFPFVDDAELTNLISIMTKLYEPEKGLKTEEKHEIFRQFVIANRLFSKKIQEFIISEL